MHNALMIYHDLIEGIADAMDARDPYTASHSVRVSVMAQQICRAMGLSKTETETIHIAAHVHDIGKIGIPDSVLLKPSALTPQQWELMKSHTEIGYRILKKVKGFEEVAVIVQHHHERWDGTGYPLGLTAGNIPSGSRIIALADAIDAMLSNRRYRADMSLEMCRREIETNIGLMFDPAAAKVILKNWIIVKTIYASYASI